MENELLRRDLEKVPRPFESPMPTAKAYELPKRERFELAKKLLRDHAADQDEPFFRESYNRSREERKTPFYENHEKRWGYVYSILDRYGTNSPELHSLRAEIKREDEFGHWRERAYSEISLIDNGWYRWEAYVSYPKPYILSRSGGRWGWDDKKLHSERKQFHSKRMAERWVCRLTKKYDEYILRLINEGVYDEHPFF